MREKSISRDALLEELQDLPPSAKLVFKILQQEGRLTQEGIAEETLLPQRTVRDALTRLEKEGITTSEISLMDARQKIYSLVPAVEIK